MLKLVGRSVSSLRRKFGNISQSIMLALVVSFGFAACMAPAGALAQNLGTAPSFNKAVQGQTASQPEGAFLNVVNWVGNVICPVGAGLMVVATVVQWRSGRGWVASAATAGGLLAVSGVTRLIEYFITNGQAVS